MSARTDMPLLNDARRVLRAVLCIDEVRDIQRKYFANDYDSVRSAITSAEFVALGGNPAAERSRFSLYRQVVWAERDMRAFCARGAFPDAHHTRAASRTYRFYDSDDEDLAEHSLSSKPKHAFRRVHTVLSVFRKFFARHRRLNTAQAQHAYRQIRMTRAEFVACGGSKTNVKGNFAKANERAFHVAVVMAKRDCETFLSNEHVPHTRMREADARRADVVDGHHWTLCVSACPPVRGTNVTSGNVSAYLRGEHRITAHIKHTCACM
jgi:hypothetical protein